MTTKKQLDLTAAEGRYLFEKMGPGPHMRRQTRAQESIARSLETLVMLVQKHRVRRT